jgi:mannose-6-phosphate isomerase
MTREHPARKKVVMPAVDLGGTKIGFAMVEIGEPGTFALEYPPAEVAKVKGRTDAALTLRRVADLVRRGTREAERKGWTVLRSVGMGAPGLYLEDGGVDPRTVPNIPGLARMKPARTLEKHLGKGWNVHINNDGVVQAVAAADALVRSPDYAKKYAAVVRKSGGKLIYFGPGTGFGAGRIRVLEDKRVAPLPGSQAFFDIVIRDGKTAEALIGGHGIGEAAQRRERRNLEIGKTVFLRFTEGYEECLHDPGESTESRLRKISGKTVAQAYLSGEEEARNQAEEILVRAGRDLASLILQLHKGKGAKKLLPWEPDDWNSVKGTRVFLVAGLLIKPTGKTVILPAARDVLKKEGYARRIHIVELDRLPEMRSLEGKIGIRGSSLLVPKDEISRKKWRASLVIGSSRIHRHIALLARRTFLEKQRPVLLAMDGYSGIDWKSRIPPLKRGLEKQGFHVTLVDFAGCYKPTGEIERMIRPSMTEEKTFGRIFGGKLEDLLDEGRIDSLRQRLVKSRQRKGGSPRAILCFGSGAACRPLRRLYDLVFYRDVTREEFTRRSSKSLVLPLGARKKEGTRNGQPGYLTGKRFHYVDFPVLDKAKKSLLKQAHAYIDDNLPARPKLIDRSALDEMISDLSRRPFQLRAFYEEGVWGGQWLKKVRNLPDRMVNCAWAYELMAYHMSVKIPLGDTFVEVPFPVLLDKEADKIMGQRVNLAFKGLWPIRVNYDDCWKGGDMAIQIHPDAPYVERNFREPLHQDESYYIMDATPDAYVYLGLKEGVDLDAFRERVRRAETEAIPFDHRKFVNLFPAKKGDLFLIPAGTVHASGKGCVVLELSATTDRYTFHLYDYLRPDLNGKLREIHAEHAFRMLRKYPNRNTSWVRKNLIQEPRCVRRGKDWAETALGKRGDLVFEVRRFEFHTTVEEDTEGVPHVLSLAEGRAAVIRPVAWPEKEFHLLFSETVVVPACTGRYTIMNPGKSPCKVIKTLVNGSWLGDISNGDVQSWTTFRRAMK